MKKLFIYPVILILLSGCSSSIFYQLYKTDSDDLKLQETALLSENPDLKIVYNFWTENGRSDFLISNKTDSSVYIDLGRSHLIVNDIAYTYFQNRTFSEASSSSYTVSSEYANYSSLYSGNSSTSVSVTGISYDNFSTISGNVGSVSSVTDSGSGSIASSKASVSKANSVTYVEQQVIIIPPHCSKVISGFKLRQAIYRDCHIYVYPNKNNLKTSRFEKNVSPFTFTNLITYAFIEDLKVVHEIKDTFWVSEITNYPNSEFEENYKPSYCGEESIYTKTRLKFSGPEKFYIKYEKNVYFDLEH